MFAIHFLYNTNIFKVDMPSGLCSATMVASAAVLWQQLVEIFANKINVDSTVGSTVFHFLDTWSITYERNASVFSQFKGFLHLEKLVSEHDKGHWLAEYGPVSM